ncbi:hypothetical protein [Tsukamurella paurometabola]|uniref:Uncharacterized protein n=1 Tax=Tsukamurella paurometabola TaxID=2061 RepID=A0A3P8MCL6_TSUPA|nr:hypothetical protein [Tsukamurella paurometabola]UEA82249.1 hypothetical protein LK411_18030 [Tsukamurella paurometabola]VDR39296.1 Uncharacterised protein [Tsukamurella paurometabola]
MRRRLSLSLIAAFAVCATVPAFAATPPPGALLGEFAQNQLENCAAICPYALQGAVRVPAGVLAAPGAAVRAAGGGPLRALGAGAAEVTRPADAAMTGIIGNDLNQVVPRFQNGVIIGVLDLMRIGRGTGSVGALRTDLLAALQQPLPPVAPTPPPLTTPPPFGITPAPQGPVETAVVHGTNAFFAAAFFVPELSLLGATQTANAAAADLAATGDPVSAVRAGLGAAGAVVAENGRILTEALTPPSTASAAERPAGETVASGGPSTGTAAPDGPTGSGGEGSDGTSGRDGPGTAPEAGPSATVDEGAPPRAGADDDVAAVGD